MAHSLSVQAAGSGTAAVRRRSTHSRTVRRLAVLALIALLSAACGDPDVTATQDPSSAEPTASVVASAPDDAPSDVPSKDPVEAPASAAPEPSALEPSDQATSEPAPTESTPAPAPPPAAVQPTADVIDLATLHTAVAAVVGRTDVAAALAELGTFPADLVFPDDAILAEVTLEETDLRILTGDPEAIRPMSSRVGGLAITLLKVEEAQPHFEQALTGIGFELSSSGFSATTEGDGTEVRTAFYNRGDDPARSENVSLTLVARPDTDYLTVDVSFTLDTDGEGLSAPVTRWVAGYPAPEGYQLQSARVTTFYFGSPSLSYNSTFKGPAGQVDVAIEQVQAALPAGGFEAGSDPTISGEPDLRFADLVVAGVGEGETAVSDSNDATNVRPLIDADFPLHPSLEPWLVG